MTLSAEGLVIQSGIGRSRHLWLIDAETLKVKRRIPIPFMCAVASPALSTAYVVGPGLQVIDLASGKVVRDSRGGITTGVEAVVMGSGPIASPDGKYIFIADGKHVLRLRVEGSDLVFEEATKSIRVGRQRVIVSSDSKRLAALCRPPKESVDAEHVGFESGAYVYDVANFRAPVTTVDLGDSTSSTTVDPTLHYIIHASRESGSGFARGHTTIRSLNGKELARLPVQDPYIMFYPHPKGGATLVGRSNLVWLVLPSSIGKASAMPSGEL